jgi:hypothetical protein
MAEKPVDEPDIAELSEVYQMLKRDAKDMLSDLLSGVTLWRSTARILFGIAITAFILGPLFILGPHFIAGLPSIGIHFAGIASGIFMLGLGVIATLSGVEYMRKYYSLRKKYSELYETAKKIS